MYSPATSSTVPGTHTVDEAVTALAAGRMVVVTDDPGREDEGDLVLAADSVTAAQMAFVVRHTTGIVCVPMPAARADALRLPLMVTDTTDSHGTAFTVSVDHTASGTGVSAADRARTVRALAARDTSPEDLRRPGHVFPLRSREGGVLARPGHTEAAVDLLRLAGREPVGVIGEIVAEDGGMARGATLRAFAARHGLPLITIADLARHRTATGEPVERVASSAMPTEFGDFSAVAFRAGAEGPEHLALVHGDVSAAGSSAAGALVRVHSECLTGDILGSLRCDCGAQLEQSLRAVAEEGAGAVVYLRGHEGRGIGLAHKIGAYALQDAGLDTVDANTALGLPVDSRSYRDARPILLALGVPRVRLLTNNPAKCAALDGAGLTVVGRIGLPVAPTSHNRRYLRTKQLRMGHLVDRGALSSEVRDLRGRASGAGTSRTAGGTRAVADA